MENMRKIVIHMDAGFAGTNSVEAWLVPVTASDEELSQFAWQKAKDHAEMYGVYPRGEYEDSDEISEEELDSDSYSDNIEGYYEDYDAKKHDDHLIYDNNRTFQWNEY